MEFKNISGLSISEIEKEVGKGVQLVIVGAGSETGKMANALAVMMASEKFACVDIGTLPRLERETINRQMSLEVIIKPDTSMEFVANELIQNIRRSAIELKSIQQDEVFLEQKKPYQEFKKKNKKLKGYQKRK